MPIGIASTIGRTEGGLAVWRLHVHGAEVPGRWVIIDGRFVVAEGASVGSRPGLRQVGWAAADETSSGLPFAQQARECTPSTFRVEVILEVDLHFRPPRASIRSTSSATPPCPRARRPYLRQDASPASAS
jgi:hypothetical protein